MIRKQIYKLMASHANFVVKMVSISCAQIVLALFNRADTVL